eukprot:TRINITY_DN58004_c0_g1_i2.p1 TRINITY_DN58004_c0_g1~~TRINITY_DN58004_c0_g1_i2.p1  ORF type:complete len:368 (-),score=85.54 TRINITY_DN58004_c0_g1_i2:342-1445(-)
MGQLDQYYSGSTFPTGYLIFVKMVVPVLKSSLGSIKSSSRKQSVCLRNNITLKPNRTQQLLCSPSYKRIRIRCQSEEAATVESKETAKPTEEVVVEAEEATTKNGTSQIELEEEVLKSESEEQAVEEKEEEKQPKGPKYLTLLQSVSSKLTEDGKEAGEADLQELQQEIEELIKKASQQETKKEKADQIASAAKEQFLRLTADFDNYRKRSTAEKADVANKERASLVEQLLPLVDNFELACGQIKTNTEAEQKINDSYQGLYRQMVDIFRGFGVTAVDTVGSPFDPEVHEAIMKEDNDDVPDGTVLEEFRKGFQIDGKLIRPAMVKVSSRVEVEQVSSDKNDQTSEELKGQEESEQKGEDDSERESA